MSNNPFPESKEKDFLRKLHLQTTLANQCVLLGRNLNYFGLPSAEMIDVNMWKPLLHHITAIERDSSVALRMYRTARKLGIRDKTIVVEMDLTTIANLLGMEEKEANLSLTQLHPSVQDHIAQIRRTTHDVINLDLCGGFLYPNENDDSENTKILRNIVKFQAKHKQAFILILTFATRDTGRDDYNSFISSTLDHLDTLNIDTDALRKHYMSKGRIGNQPPNLRRLRFCVPVYIHKIAYDYFQVSSVGAWYYKTFYHTALFFEPRKGISALGKAWPPLDEFKDLLSTPMMRLIVNDLGKVIEEDLPAPYLN